MNLQHLVAEAVALGGGNLCAAGHNWQSDGGRECPKGWSYGALDGCSQTVYVCKRCGIHDYGEEGGPAHRECFENCGRENLEEEPEDQNDSPFCECGAVHGIEEVDSNRCDACGKEIE